MTPILYWLQSVPGGIISPALWSVPSVSQACSCGQRRTLEWLEFLRLFAITYARNVHAIIPAMHSQPTASKMTPCYCCPSWYSYSWVTLFPWVWTRPNDSHLGTEYGKVTGCYIRGEVIKKKNCLAQSVSLSWEKWAALLWAIPWGGPCDQPWDQLHSSDEACWQQWEWAEMCIQSWDNHCPDCQLDYKLGGRDLGPEAHNSVTPWFPTYQKLWDNKYLLVLADKFWDYLLHL